MFDLPLVKKVEDGILTLYYYFTHSNKRQGEFEDLANVLETEGLNILCNTKTRWISMLAPAKTMLQDLKTLVKKMWKDA